jgi:hypothetical protein
VLYQEELDTMHGSVQQTQQSSIGNEPHTAHVLESYSIPVQTSQMTAGAGAIKTATSIERSNQGSKIEQRTQA